MEEKVIGPGFVLRKDIIDYIIPDEVEIQQEKK